MANVKAIGVRAKAIESHKKKTPGIEIEYKCVDGVTRTFTGMLNGGALKFTLDALRFSGCTDEEIAGGVFTGVTRKQVSLNLDEDGEIKFVNESSSKPLAGNRVAEMKAILAGALGRGATASSSVPRAPVNEPEVEEEEEGEYDEEDAVEPAPVAAAKPSTHGTENMFGGDKDDIPF